jgi:hypothetical protein
MVIVMSQITHLGQNLFQVEYMPWERFFEALMNPQLHKAWWEGLREVDCIIGSADYSISYLWVDIVVQAHTCTGLIFFLIIVILPTK